MKFENLPPINSLRYFEAAARCGSFTLAAVELNVTQGAVSQQVRNLENFLETILFTRGATNITLTNTGRVYLSAVTAALQKIDNATSKIKNGKALETCEICLSASPSFINAWLVNRLPKFHREIKGIALSLNATRHYVDFDIENVDMAIRHGIGQWPGLHSDLLMKDSIIAVCSPDLIAKKKLHQSLSEITKCVLIEDKIHRYWARYASAINEEINLSDAILFDDSGVIIHAAINAQGVAMVRASLVEGALSAGQLIKLFDANFTDRVGYYIVYPESETSNKAINRVSRWLKREAWEN